MGGGGGATLIAGVALHAAVPAEVVIGAVPVALPVGAVVLVVIGAQVVQREAVVRHNEVDALVWAPALPGGPPLSRPLIQEGLHQGNSRGSRAQM